MPDTPINILFTSLEPFQCENCGEQEISRLLETDMGFYCDFCIEQEEN